MLALDNQLSCNTGFGVTPFNSDKNADDKLTLLQSAHSLDCVPHGLKFINASIKSNSQNNIGFGIDAMGSDIKDMITNHKNFMDEHGFDLVNLRVRKMEQPKIGSSILDMIYKFNANMFLDGEHDV